MVHRSTIAAAGFATVLLLAGCGSDADAAPLAARTR